jgi:hypothetical protein
MASPFELKRLLLALLATTACASIVGIDDAEVDPTFSPGPTGGTSGAAGTSPVTGGGGGAAGHAHGGLGAEGGTVSTGGADAGDSLTALCDEYCETVMENCPGPLQVYTSARVCGEICRQFAVGVLGETTGHSIHCRLEHAHLAVDTGEPEIHCPAAGPGGDGICGDNCQGYCSLMTAFCDPVDVRLADCRTACGDVPDEGGYDIRDTLGDTVQCRLYHVSAAALDAALHCPHAIGRELCVP